MAQEEYEDNLEFWNKYNLDWKSPSDVKRFVCWSIEDREEFIQ